MAPLLDHQRDGWRTCRRIRSNHADAGIRGVMEGITMEVTVEQLNDALAALDQLGAIYPKTDLEQWANKALEELFALAEELGYDTKASPHDSAYVREGFSKEESP